MPRPRHSCPLQCTWACGSTGFATSTLFLLNAVAGVVIAVLLVAWKHWIPFFLVLGLGACTLGAFTISATVGLFGLHEHWVGNLVWTAAIAEAVA